MISLFWIDSERIKASFRVKKFFYKIICSFFLYSIKYINFFLDIEKVYEKNSGCGYPQIISLNVIIFLYLYFFLLKYHSLKTLNLPTKKKEFNCGSEPIQRSKRLVYSSGYRQEIRLDLD